LLSTTTGFSYLTVLKNGDILYFTSAYSKSLAILLNTIYVPVDTEWSAAVQSAALACNVSHMEERLGTGCSVLSVEDG